MAESFKTFHEKSFAEQVDIIRRQFADEWEELVTRPGSRWSNEEFGYVDIARRGEKIEKNTAVRDKLVRICQEYRLTPDQIDLVLTEIIEPGTLF